jgi:S-DNA-T family DNA segregation ATPase FtsK/SpoIIIE
MRGDEVPDADPVYDVESEGTETTGEVPTGVYAGQPDPRYADDPVAAQYDGIEEAEESQDAWSLTGRE